MYERGPILELGARIIHVSDAYDAMTTDRPYRRGMSHEGAIAILHEHAGSHFDPWVVAIFASLSCHEASRKDTTAVGA